MRARWKRCVDQLDGQLPDALSQKFVEKTWAKKASGVLSRWWPAIEKMMGQDIQSLDWMTPADQRAGHGQAARAWPTRSASRQHWLDYSKVPIVARRRLREWRAHQRSSSSTRQLAKIGKPVDKTDWDMSQPTVNAYYDPQENDINFPAGILQPPFFDNKMDDAVNYGAHRRGDRP